MLQDRDPLIRYLDAQLALIPPDAPSNMVPLVELAAWMDGDSTLAVSAFMALDPHSPDAALEWLAWRALIMGGSMTR